MSDRAKTLLKSFFLTFLVLLVIGAISGLGDRKRVAAAVAMQHLVFQENSLAGYLAMFCHDRVTRRYDIDAINVERNPSDLANLDVVPSILSLEAHKDLIFSVVGGSSGAVTIDTLSQVSKRSGPNQLGVIIIGLASGYLLGYSAATAVELDCDSPSVNALLENAENWRPLKHDYLTFLLYKHGIRGSMWFNDNEGKEGYVTVHEIQKNANNETFDRPHREYLEYRFSPIFQCPTKLGSQLRSLVARLAKGADPDRADFRLATRYPVLLRTLNAHSSYRNLSACIAALALPVVPSNPQAHSSPEHRVTPAQQDARARAQESACAAIEMPQDLLLEASTRSYSSAHLLALFHDDRLLWFQSRPEFRDTCDRVLRDVLGGAP